ncbi:MAG: ABC transporter ATP-binding protein [Christensenellales bacterium]
MENKSNYVLSVQGVTKIFGKDRAAVNNVSFNIARGEIYGLIGQNGAGKTTIIRVITGLAKATSGKVFVCGYDIEKDFQKAVANIGGIIENPELYSYMSGMDNLKYYASLYGKVDKNKIDKIVAMLGMENRINDKVKTYSLGMKQRVGICQALLHDPKLLILDEPTNGLDPNGIKDMRMFLKKLAKEQGIAILISSHILAEMELICDRIGIIDNGMIIENKTMEELQQGLNSNLQVSIKVDYPNYAGKILFDKYPTSSIFCIGSRVVIEAKNEDIPVISSLLINKGISIYGISTVTRSLEDIFLEIVHKGKEQNIL